MLNNVKVCVYAICKNEEKFVERWLEAVDEADYITVLDTGSVDNTKNLFEEYSLKNPGKLIFKSYDYGNDFRFDIARNDSLKLVPFDTDVCVVFDLDQIPVEGWSQIVREEYSNERLATGYIVDHDENGNETRRWRSKNVHPNSPYYIWTKPIHEGIHCIKEDSKFTECFCNEFTINHYPDATKDRSLYTDLLRKAVAENPTDPYYVNYLGVELSKNGHDDEAIGVYKNGLDCCSFDSDKFLKFQMYINLGSLLVNEDPAQALNCYEDAEDMGIKTRRLYVYMADVYKKVADTNMEIFYLLKALKDVKSYSHDWRDDFDYFNGVIEDRLALLYYYKAKDYILALKYGVEALSYQPENVRLKNNVDYFYKAYKGVE